MEKMKTPEIGDAAFVRILKLSFVRMAFYRVLTLSEWVLLCYELGESFFSFGYLYFNVNFIEIAIRRR